MMHTVTIPLLLSAALPSVELPSAELLPAQSLSASGASTTAHMAHSHTHAPNEINEVHGPILLEVTYTGEVMSNVDGGIRQGTRALDNLDLVMEADLNALIGWSGAEIHVYGLYNNGTSVSDLVGDSFAVSNIETGTRALRLYEAWIEQKFDSGFSLKFGLYDLNSEFDAIESSALFVGSAHGIGADISQAGLNGPSIFPFTSLALRAEKSFESGVKIRAAILDGVPADPAHPKRTALKLDADDGALIIAEVDIPLMGGEGRLLAGHWRYTGAFDDFAGAQRRDNAGLYLRGETLLLQKSGTRLDGFFRLGLANGKLNMYRAFTSGGVKLTGLFAADTSDEAGFAIATAWTSDDYRRTTGAGRSETAFELTYRRSVLPFLTIQPSVQYIRTPSADPGIDDALVLGMRAEISFRL